MSNNIASAAPHGWIILDKPLGLTSSQAVGVVKRLARAAGWGKIKVGHGGTLDPLATGVLPIALGEATKLTGRMLDADKEYAFEVTFGAATATDDAEGAVVAESSVRPTLAALQAALPAFTGPIRQRPPAYSALKVDGRRAYALARAGEAVELAEREVTVHALQILPGTGRGTTDASAAVVEGCAEQAQSLRSPPHHQPAAGPPPRAGEDHLDSATLLVRCSKGTYVRSLARDLALALGTVGHVRALRRTRAGPFGEGQAWAVDKLEALCDGRGLGEAVLPLTAGLDGIPALAVDGPHAAALRQGRTLPARPGATGLHLAVHGRAPVALVIAAADGVRVERGFNLPDAAE